MNIRTVSILAVLLDQVSKFLVVHYCKLEKSITIIRDYFYVTYIQNPGAAFGFMASAPAYARIPFFIVITLGAGLIVYAYQRFIPPERKLQRFSLGLIWGGAMGNFIDRIFYREVVDFIDVRYYWHHLQNQWYVFNIADSCISVGLAFLLLTYFQGKDGRPEKGF